MQRGENNLNTDLTFFTNEENMDLSKRFIKILKSNTQYFDVLVGYFRTSGFYELSESLKNIDKMRILVGLNVDKKTIEILNDESITLSTKEVTENFNETLIKEMEESEDTNKIEIGIRSFIKYIKDKKIEMRIYPHSPLHSKVYIMRKNEELSDDFGKVITGSSNFSKSGLKGNLEFNVELKNSGDVRFALNKFEELWKESIDITDEYSEIINEKTWLKEGIEPYELYLKFLYEFFEEEINSDKTDFKGEFLPEGFKKFDYQIHAVNQAKKILNKYNGVFLADVVGLGKTYITALLARELHGGRKLFIVPPVLVDYWRRILEDFGVEGGKVISLGKLDNIIENYSGDYFKYIFVDEAHRFRNDGTENYSKLHEICVDKKVTLISATPQNNYSSDILNLIKLFQPKNDSDIIDDEPDIEGFFRKLQTKEKKFRKIYKDNPTAINEKNLEECIKINSGKIRDRVLRKIMVRRVRSEIEKYYKDDMEKKGLKFPKLDFPKQIVYEFDEKVDAIFEELLNLIEKISYARYKTLTYLINPPADVKILLIGQMNLKGFMKTLLIKRLESSFYAFKQTVTRFKESHENFINMFNTGKVYISKKYNVYDLLGSENEDRLEELVESEEIQSYLSEEFNEKLIIDIEKDLKILDKIFLKISQIKKDPKLDSFIKELKTNKKLKDSKKIIFTESKETAEYLKREISKKLEQPVISFTGSSSNIYKDKIRANYDPDYPKNKQENKFRILVTTDVLAEGINLHRANTLINYDLPWNPTKVMQRVGRINRVGTTFDEINVFNFFPTSKSNNYLSLKDNIINKIKSFHKTFGEDSKFLSEDEEIESYNFIGEKLYEKLNENLNYAEEELGDSELKYLCLLRNIRDNEKNLFEKIKKLPKKSRSSKSYEKLQKSVISFIKDGEIKRIYISDNNGITKEMSFEKAVQIMKCKENEKRIRIDEKYFDMLNSNKNYFKEFKRKKEMQISKPMKKSGNDGKLKKILEILNDNKKQFTNNDEEKIKKLKYLFTKGYLNKNIVKKIVKEIDKIMKKEINLFKILEIAYEEIPESYKKIEIEKRIKKIEKVEVILSEYIEH